VNLLVLAAGHATRLRPLTDNCAKPLLPVNGRAIIDHLLDKFHDCPEIEDVYVVTNGKYAHDFERWAKTAAHPWPVHVLNDGTASVADSKGAIGDIAFALDAIDSKREIIIAAGDNLVSESMELFTHLSRSVADMHSMLIGTYDVGSMDAAKNYGQVTLDREGLRVLAFDEKPERAIGTTVSAGLYCLPGSARILVHQYLNSGGKPDAPGRLIQWLLRFMPCYAYQLSGRWLDIGSKETYGEAERTWR